MMRATTEEETYGWRGRLAWSGLTLFFGGITPFLLLWWVASHRLRQPVGSWELIRAAYTDPYEPFGWMHLLALPPFILLAVVCLTGAKWLTRLERMPAFVMVNLLLASLPMYFLVWPIRHNYLRHESAIFVSMAGLMIGAASVLLVAHSWLILHRIFLRPTWPD